MKAAYRLDGTGRTYFPILAILAVLASWTGCAKPAPDPILPAIPATVRPGTTLRADPDPVLTAEGPAETTLIWTTTAKHVQIHVSAPNGPLMGNAGSSGSAKTGDWVRNGMTFYLQDQDAADPESPSATLASIPIVVQ
jgi:hypothetical protein